MNDFIISQIRTAVPLIVGAFVAWLTTKGIKISPADASSVVPVLTALFSGLYYLIVRTLETKLPAAGWLLGIAKKITYTKVV